MLMPKSLHPTSRTLISYLDGELPIDERHEIQAHLSGCPCCRDEVDLMEADLDWFLVLEAASRTQDVDPPTDGLNRLLAATRRWTALQAAADGGNAQRVNEALEVFFGKGVNVAPEKAESLLATFLGQRATAALMADLRRNNPMWAPDAH